MNEPGSATPPALGPVATASAASLGAPPVAGPEEGIARLTAIEGELIQIEGALARLDDGTYGLCAVCGGGLWGDQLDRDPLATLCTAHAGLVNGP